MKNPIKLLIKFLFTALLVLPVLVFAHPGNTASDGMHYCWTNCSYWGEITGQRHSHGGGSTYYTPSYSSYTTPTTYVSTYKYNYDCPSYGFAYNGSCYALPDNSYKSGMSGFACDYGYQAVGTGLSKQCLPNVTNGYYIGTALFCNYGYTNYLNTCIKEQAYTTNFIDYSTYTNTTTSNTVGNQFGGKRFKYFYEFNQTKETITKRPISDKCIEYGEDDADAPYFRDGGLCYYCSPGSIPDSKGEECHLMTDVCEVVLGDNSKVLSDGKCGCEKGYTKKKDKCLLQK